MNHRPLGNIGTVSEVGYGAWEIGSDWGPVAEQEAKRALEAAYEVGIDFFDTADVYGDGRSERFIREVLRDEIDSGEVTVATKVGRRLDPHTVEGYTESNLRAFVDRSRENLDVETLDLVQLHCPPTDAYYRPGIFAAMDDLAEEGRINAYGVSVEKVEQGLKAIEYPNVDTVQIIFNPFRQRPKELFFDEAARRNIGVIVRVPLASGLLTGNLGLDTEFAEDDHRNFNREGEAFDVGETFAGVPYDVGLRAVDELESYCPDRLSMAQLSLRWILDHSAVSTVIPGSTTPSHIKANGAASTADSLDKKTHQAIERVYDEHIHEYVHHQW